ncbi:PaREP1 family protein [Pyrobaculum sp.]|uniref:PaREP1 family protein n=1 Tax=Pyrobaculum sp. TaxID=2004705 RepID=UPI0031765179
MDVVVEKPWRNLQEYIKARLEEAAVELQLALILMGEGYTRNAAGKLFQAFKSYLAAAAGEKREELAARLREVDKLIAYMPTRALVKISTLLGLEREARVALALRQYQYNGPDPEGITSLYPDRESAKRDFCWLAKRLIELTGSEKDLYTKACGAPEVDSKSD